MYKSCKKQIQFIIISCCVLGSAFSASLFGVDITAPAKVVKSGVGAISQAWQPHTSEFLNTRFGAHTQHRTNNKPTSTGLSDNIKPEKPLINKLTPETESGNQLSTRKPIKEKVPMPIESGQTTDEEQGPDDFMLGSAENGPDYTTTESVDYEIGGPPPAVLACLLGSGCG